ncbi:ATP-binding protein [Brevibacillus sp. MER 51]|uniref:ATP-binding protein n=1 Tax=Brevibacillus sp. MER 51 TaxID=2939560 RepID=UPI002041A3CA|nr:ATP-binding protein [Brevibacillus sp. MER 51]MCM3144391.1 ATP-binding protein [Brevibacillus sp. MER 51]
MVHQKKANNYSSPPSEKNPGRDCLFSIGGHRLGWLNYKEINRKIFCQSLQGKYKVFLQYMKSATIWIVFTKNPGGKYMVKLVFEGRLDTVSDIHDLLGLCKTAFDILESAGDLTIDLSKLTMISTVGSLALLSALDTLDRFFYLDISIPENTGVIGYLERIDFFKYCPPDVKTSFESQINMDRFYNRRRNDTTKTLLEIQKMYSNDDVVRLCKSIRGILSNNNVGGNKISDVVRIASELSSNAIEHGNWNAYSSIQYYPTKGTIEIAIGDNGVGIYNTLSEHVISHDKHDVIHQAVMTRATSLPLEDRGKGLMDVRKTTFSRSYFADIYIRTHDSIYQIFPEGLKLLHEGNYFWGTFIHIVLHV